MDLFDLTRLLFRRWYFALPLLLVSLTGVLLLSRTVDPDYSAEGHLQLLPATGSADTSTTTTGKGTTKQPTRVHNPWGDLGYNALGQAAIVKVEDESVAKGLTSAGLSDSFTVTIEYGTSFLSIEAIGTSAPQATATVQRLMTVLAQFVESEQSRFGVAKVDMITTLALDHGEKVTVVTSKQKRVLIVAAGIGLLTSAGATIGLDALLRRRTKRAAGPDDQAEAEAERDGGEATRLIRPTKTGVGSRRAGASVRVDPPPVSPAPAMRAPASVEETQTIIPPNTVLMPRATVKREGKVFRAGAGVPSQPTPPSSNGDSPNGGGPRMGTQRDDRSR
ncbi:hypothetical protein ACIA5D_41195 [Actinoplanes sp. NPDC051513]|uniref:hypothetical protein n=1 Tax=Actinoplanes sp. NPDC051513 TaxID=3363908 RepID=UPI0037ABABCA